ncbi:PPE domain-containing protein [Rhodococcus sp. 14-2470-1b]|uniref:PPE domain-containing protein n=1 Tax=Rhodococcus sp. 14-2470-1b TaxID=2023149 RepID=UPI0020CF3295|nr:PPE domain-containing protein [Rhodococcus sp. 14-2470-1b]
MTLGVTGVVWMPRLAMVNSTSLLAGAGAAPLATAGGAWQAVAAAYADTSITLTRVMAVLAAGWEGEAANAAQERLGGFLAWTQGVTAKATQISGMAAGEAAAYSTAALTMPNPVEIGAVQSAKIAAYGAGGALNGSAQALEVAERALDVRAGLVMEGYEAATTPLALQVSFDHPPKIVNDSAVSGAVDSAGRPIDSARSHSETGIFGFSANTSPAQAALAAVGSALQNPALASAAGQIASTAGSVAGSSVTTVASAATNIGSAAVSSLMSSNSSSTGQASSPASFRTESPTAGTTSTRAVSASNVGVPGAGGLRSGGGFGSAAGSLGSPVAGSPSSGPGVGSERAVGTGSMFGSAAPDGAAAARGAHGAGPVGAGHSGNNEDDEHDTPGYLRQFEHFSDGRTVAPSVIGADPSWNDR